MQNIIILQGFKVARKDRECCSRLSGGGVAIVVQGGTATRDGKLNTSFEAIAATILSKNTTTICSFYIPPHTHFTTKHLENIAEQLPKLFILVGDFNAHSTVGVVIKQGRSLKILFSHIISAF